MPIFQNFKKNMERKGAALCRIFKTKTKVPEMLIEIRDEKELKL